MNLARMGWSLALFGGLVVAPCASAQDCGWSRVDHEVAYSDTGAWNPSVYRGVVYAATAAQIAGAAWEGSQTRFGRTLWQGIDAEILGGAGAAAGKYVFTRARPTQGDNPCLWFQGGSHYSFPSGEAAVAASLVTPYVLEYGEEYPATYLLALLPVYVGAGRVKNNAHWQTDVVAGWIAGGAAGWYAHERETPLLIEVLPHGAAVGLRRSF